MAPFKYSQHKVHIYINQYQTSCEDCNIRGSERWQKYISDNQTIDFTRSNFKLYTIFLKKQNENAMKNDGIACVLIMQRFNSMRNILSIFKSNVLTSNDYKKQINTYFINLNITVVRNMNRWHLLQVINDTYLKTTFVSFSTGFNSGLNNKCQTILIILTCPKLKFEF